jgi:hypothetical protein
MRVELLTDKLPDLFPMRERTMGDDIVHLSEIVSELAIVQGYMKQYDSDNLPWNKMIMGKAMEKALCIGLVEEYPDRYVDLGETERDGILFTIDLGDHIINAPHEMKLSWLSSRYESGSSKLWRFEHQLMGYACALKSKYGFLHVVYPRGDYSKDNFDCDYRLWKYTYGEREKTGFWDLCRRTADEIRKRRYKAI